MKTKHVAVLVSGGFDSNILLGLACKNKKQKIHPIYIACGFNWETAELFWLKKYLRKINFGNLGPLKVLQVPMQDILPLHYGFKSNRVPGLKSADLLVDIPGRNLMLLAKTSIWCAQNNISEIWLGILKGNPFADSTPKFFKTFAQAFKAGLGCNIKIKTPFANKTKAQVLKFGKDLPLHLCFSCLNPNKQLQTCNKCNKCAERMKFYA